MKKIKLFFFFFLSLFFLFFFGHIFIVLVHSFVWFCYFGRYEPQEMCERWREKYQNESEKERGKEKRERKANEQTTRLHEVNQNVVCFFFSQCPVVWRSKQFLPPYFQNSQHFAYSLKYGAQIQISLPKNLLRIVQNFIV